MTVVDYTVTITWPNGQVEDIRVDQDRAHARMSTDVAASLLRGDGADHSELRTRVVLDLAREQRQLPRSNLWDELRSTTSRRRG